MNLPRDDGLERLAALAVDAVAAASAGEPVAPADDPVSRRVGHVVDAIAGARRPPGGT